MLNNWIESGILDTDEIENILDITNKEGMLASEDDNFWGIDLIV